MSAIEVTLRVGGVVLLALLAMLMLRTRRRDRRGWYGAALAFSVGTFLLTSMPGADARFGPLIYPLTAICATHPVWFWLFCVALFSDGMKLSRVHLACLAGMAVAGTVYQTLLDPGVATGDAAASKALGVVFGFVSLGFAGLGPRTVFAGNSADLDERRRQIRGWFVPLAATYLAIVIITQMLTVLAWQQTPKPVVLANLAFIDGIALAALLSFLRVRVVNWLDLAEPAPAVESLNRVEQALLDRLRLRFEAERLYARENLTIAALAELLDSQEHVLRRVINRGLGFRNFNDFLHTYRLREASARLRDPKERRLPVLSIALDVGYGSVGPFNRAFKERYGMTPGEYRSVTPAPSSPAPAAARYSR